MRVPTRFVQAVPALAVAVMTAACRVVPEDSPSGVQLGESPGRSSNTSSAGIQPSTHRAKPEPVGPLTLERALALAWERNPDLRAAEERIGAARARLDEAASAFYPQLGVRVSYVRTDNPAQAFGMIVAQRGFGPGIDVNDPGAIRNYRSELYGAVNLFRGGQDLHAREAARHGLEAAELERRALRNALAEAVTAAYYALRAAQEHVGVTEVSVQAVESELAEAQERFAAGALLKSDVLSLEVRRATAQEARVRARNAVEHARTGLRILLALSPDDPVEVDPGGPEPGPPVPEDFGEALAQALRDRPELRAMAKMLEVRRSELAAEKASFLPRVDVFGAYGQDSETFEFDRDQDNWTIGVAVELDLFSGFRKSARVRGSERRWAEARALQEKVRLQVEQEVKSALLALQEARERAVVTGTAVAAAEEALRLVREQYRAGAATVTRYLEAEAALADARSRSIAARFDVRRGEAGVRKAIGFWK